MHYIHQHENQTNSSWFLFLLQAMNVGEVHVAKLTYVLEQLYQKCDEMLSDLEKLERIKDTRIAKLARELYPQILHPDYIPGRRRRKVIMKHV